MIDYLSLAILGGYDPTPLFSTSSTLSHSDAIPGGLDGLNGAQRGPFSFVPLPSHLADRETDN